MEHRDLDKVYEDIEIDEPELESYRSRLEASLRTQESSVKPSSIFFRRLADLRATLIQRPAILRVATAGIATAVLVIIFQAQTPALDSVDLDELRAIVSRYDDARVLYREAKNMEQSDMPLLRLNGLYIMTALAQKNENILASARGLIEDPRAEFRAYYLEYLLTNADEAYFDIEYIESLIERENDQECLELLYELLSLAESSQRAESRFI